MHIPLCVCSLIAELRPKLAAVKTRVIILMHHREENLASNTARIAAMSLPHCEIRIRGVLNQPLSTEGFRSSDRPTFFLYPSEEAIELTPEFAVRLTSAPTLIVPDGNWKQASKVASRLPELQGIPHLKLPVGIPAQYHLRKGPREGCLSTYEAIARAVGILETPDAQKEMETFFEKRVERALWARGKIKLDDCKHAIPQSVFDFFREAGKAGSVKSQAQALARKSRSNS